MNTIAVTASPDLGASPKRLLRELNREAAMAKLANEVVEIEGRATLRLIQGASVDPNVGRNVDVHA